MFEIKRADTAFQATPKRKPVKDKDYLGFIAALPCIVSGLSGVQVCHLSYQSTKHGHYGRAKGHKAHDRWALPMTPEWHQKQHDGSERTFWEVRVRIDPHLACVVLYGLYNEAGMDAVEQAAACIMSGAFRI